jgi:predicted AAA+ superfamily ATPase
MDSLQLLMDTHGAQWKFVLTGSSARKIRIAGGNLLPGRIFEKRLDPLLWDELGLAGKAGREHLTPVPRPEAPAGKPRTSVRWKLEDALTWGCLPEIPNLSKEDRAETLRSYVSLYLEQEIRAEALVRKLGAFNRFLELAAREAGTAPNLTRLSQESGVSVPAIQSYYAILEDTFVVERIEPYLRNARKRLMATPRYYFFDPGVRNACAGLPLEPGLLATEGGRLFEHHIILETVRRIRLLDSTAKVHYWRTSHGAEVDMVVDLGDELVPIEIKYTANVRRGDLTGIKSFLEDYGRKVRMAWVVSLAPKPRKIDDKITVIPWTAV